MKYLLMFIVCFGFLTSCERKADEENAKVTALEKQVAALKQQLEQSTDPATISKLQKQLIGKLLTNVFTKEEQIVNLYTQIEQTTDEASCNALKMQIEQANKELKALRLEAEKLIVVEGEGIYKTIELREVGTCSVTGYACPIIVDKDDGSKWRTCLSSSTLIEE